MTREEFEGALDQYEERGFYFPYDIDRDFLWDLMTEGLSAVDKLPPKPKSWEPIDYRHRPYRPGGSRYAIMNEEVKLLQSGASQKLINMYQSIPKAGQTAADIEDELSQDYGHTEGYSFYHGSGWGGSLPLIAYAKHRGSDFYTLMSITGEKLNILAEEFDCIWPDNLTEKEGRA